MYINKALLLFTVEVGVTETRTCLTSKTGPAEPIGQVGFWPDQKSHEGGWLVIIIYSAITCNISLKQLVGKPCNLINELSCTGVASYFVDDS